MIEFTDDNFQTEVLESTIPVLVDFSAPWCPPCRVINPMIEELAKEYKDVAKVGKMNIDNCPNTTAKYSIDAIPALLIFKNGTVVERVLGVKAKSVFQGLLNSAKD